MINIQARLNISQEELAAFCRKWSVAKLWLFGSVVREDFRPDSDIDVMVEFQPEADASMSLWGIVRMKDELEAMVRRPVDIIEPGTVRNPFRKQSIERDLSMIYAA